MWCLSSISSSLFLSTPSARRATATYTPVPFWLDIFLSTPSARRATAHSRPRETRVVISIHALREEGDPSAFLFVDRIEDFYPRPPRGGRPDAGRQNGGFHIFLSTPSARRATGDSTTVNTRLVFLSTPSARRATGQARRS